MIFCFRFASQDFRDFQTNLYSKAQRNYCRNKFYRVQAVVAVEAAVTKMDQRGKALPARSKARFVTCNADASLRNMHKQGTLFRFDFLLLFI